MDRVLVGEPGAQPGDVAFAVPGEHLDGPDRRLVAPLVEPGHARGRDAGLGEQCSMKSSVRSIRPISTRWSACSATALGLLK